MTTLPRGSKRARPRKRRGCSDTASLRRRNPRRAANNPAVHVLYYSRSERYFFLSPSPLLCYHPSIIDSAENSGGIKLLKLKGPLGNEPLDTAPSCLLGMNGG